MDSLRLVGIKRLAKHTGSDLTLVTPTRGGDHHKIPQWWSANPKSTVYINCTKFSVNRPDGDVVIFVPSSADTRLDIKYDNSSDTWTFGAGSIGVERVGVFTSSHEIIEEYVFPKISGGKVMKVTPPNAAAYPS